MKKVFQVLSKNDIVNILEINSYGVYSFLNPYSALKAPESGVKYAIDSFYLATIIGVEQASFDNSSIASILFEILTRDKKSVVFIGGSRDEALAFRNNLVSNFQFEVHVCNGFEQKKSYVDLLKAIRPNYVVIGMGTPLQEKTALELLQCHHEATYLTCGGFISQASRSLMYFPYIFTALRIHFVYRIIRERHVLKRVIRYYPKFIYEYIIKKIDFERE